MTHQALIPELLHAHFRMVAGTVADFTDEEMARRPLPEVNCPAWALGHLVYATHAMFTPMGVPLAPLPEGFAERFPAGRQAPRIADTATWPPKAELLGMLEAYTTDLADFARSASDSVMATPAPEAIRGFAPDLLRLFHMHNSHLMMHMGQMQVARRALGKPLLF